MAGKQANEDKHFWVMHTDCFMESTFKIEMIQGRFFSADFPTDQSSAFVINESAAQSMEMKSPLHEEIDLWGRGGSLAWRRISILRRSTLSLSH